MAEILYGDKNQIYRRKKILRLLENENTLRVTALSDIMDVSVVTIRKDLDELEREGFLTRIHGGAIVKSETLQYGADFESRMKVKSEEKRRIAKHIGSMVHDGDSVIITAGSTCVYVCEELRRKNDLIIITNSYYIFSELVSCPNITTLYLGGRFDCDMQITVGEDVIEQLAKYTASKLITGSDGVEIRAGITSYNHIEDSIIRQMIAQSKEKILAVDDSKIGKVAFAHIADINEFDTIVTSVNAEKREQVQAIERMGIRVIDV